MQGFAKTCDVNRVQDNGPSQSAEHPAVRSSHMRKELRFCLDHSNHAACMEKNAVVKTCKIKYFILD